MCRFPTAQQAQLLLNGNAKELKRALLPHLQLPRQAASQHVYETVLAI